MDQAEELRRLSQEKRDEENQQSGGRARTTKMIAVASGKGGVGKTNVVANLGYALTKLGKRVLIFDCDLGLGNIDILLGIASRVTMEHVLAGASSIAEALKDGPGGMKILPAASGVQKLAHIDSYQQLQISAELDELSREYDVILLDIGAGISANVTYFCTQADEIFVIATPEPTSITDAYALIKVLHKDYRQNRFKLVVNNVPTPQEAKTVYKQLSMVVDKFLENISLDYSGFVLHDDNLIRCVKQQRLILELFPFSRASKCYTELAHHTAKRLDSEITKTNTVGGFFRAIMEK